MTMVTIAIPCFGHADILGRALDSALAQTWPAREIIVIDDGSPAEEAQRISLICEKADPNIRVLRVTNRGLPNARNTALMLAQGDAFLPLDADDWLDPTFIEKTVPHLKTADIVCVGLQEHGARVGTFMPGYDRPLNLVTPELLERQNNLFYCCLYSTALLRSVGGWNGRMINGWEDWDLWWDLFRRSNVSFAAVNEVLFHYDVRTDGMAYETDRLWRDWNLNEMRRHHHLSDNAISAPAEPTPPGPRSHTQRLGVLGRLSQRNP